MIADFNLTLTDLLTFTAFIAFVIIVSLVASRSKEQTEESYFLAGRKLTWWLIGFSLIASNISTEHFVGMAGSGYSMGLAVASYEWIAAVTLVAVALFFLPKFLRSGIFTIPQYLEYRYSPVTRTIMAALMMVMYIVVMLAVVLYSGAIALDAIFGMDVTRGIWLIGLLAGAYTVYGGLKAVVWSDLIQGAALILGGAIVMFLGFQAIGGPAAFFDVAGDKLHMVLPADHPEIPWTALLVGIWIPNFFYWGLNQFITQRTLGARSLGEGQNGIMFAAFLKLLMPFIIVFPGIMAYHLYAGSIEDPNKAFPYMMVQILPAGLRGLMFAALFGAVMSTLDSVLNSASAIFTIDIYKRYIRPETDSRRLVVIGRVVTAVFVVFGCIYAPVVGRYESVFTYIQEIWGFVSPAVFTVFIFGLFSKRTPAIGAIGSFILGVILYGIMYVYCQDIAFLNRMAIIVGILSVWNIIVTIVRPLPEPVKMPVIEGLDLTPSRTAPVYGALVVILTVVLYVVFW